MFLGVHYKRGKMELLAYKERKDRLKGLLRNFKIPIVVLNSNYKKTSLDNILMISDDNHHSKVFRAMIISIILKKGPLKQQHLFFCSASCWESRESFAELLGVPANDYKVWESSGKMPWEIEHKIRLYVLDKHVSNMNRLYSAYFASPLAMVKSYPSTTEILEKYIREDLIPSLIRSDKKQNVLRLTLSEIEMS